MTGPLTSRLDIRNWASNDHDGFTNTTTSNGKTYCYKWTGGSDGNGNVTEDLRAGVGEISIQLVADRRYHITSCSFGNQNTQFSYVPADNWNGKITDAGTAAEEDHFSVLITSTLPGDNNCTFTCDPAIRNIN